MGIWRHVRHISFWHSRVNDVTRRPVALIFLSHVFQKPEGHMYWSGSYSLHCTNANKGLKKRWWWCGGALALLVLKPKFSAERKTLCLRQEWRWKLLVWCLSSLFAPWPVTVINDLMLSATFLVFSFFFRSIGSLMREFLAFSYFLLEEALHILSGSDFKRKLQI